MPATAETPAPLEELVQLEHETIPAHYEWLLKADTGQLNIRLNEMEAKMAPFLGADKANLLRYYLDEIIHDEFMHGYGLGRGETDATGHTSWPANAAEVTARIDFSGEADRPTYRIVVSATGTVLPQEIADRSFRVRSVELDHTKAEQPAQPTIQASRFLLEPQPYEPTLEQLELGYGYGLNSVAASLETEGDRLEVILFDAHRHQHLPAQAANQPLRHQIIRTNEPLVLSARGL